MGDTDGIAAILRDVVRPRAAYLAAQRRALRRGRDRSTASSPGPPMIRMWVDRTTFQPSPAQVERLLPVEVGELNRLYQLGFAAWLPVERRSPRACTTGSASTAASSRPPAPT